MKRLKRQSILWFSLAGIFVVLIATIIYPFAVVKNWFDNLFNFGSKNEQEISVDYQQETSHWQQTTRISMDQGELLACMQENEQEYSVNSLNTCLFAFDTEGKFTDPRYSVTNSKQAYNAFKNVDEFQGMVSLNAFNKIIRPALYTESHYYKSDKGWELTSRKENVKHCKEYSSDTSKVSCVVTREEKEVYPYISPIENYEIKENYGFKIENEVDKKEARHDQIVFNNFIEINSGKVVAPTKCYVLNKSGSSMTLSVNNGFPFYMKLDGIQSNVNQGQNLDIEDELGTANNNLKITTYKVDDKKDLFFNPQLLYEPSAYYDGASVPTDPMDSKIYGSLQEAINKCLGLPYVWGGSDLRGMDCSGFVWYVFQKSNLYEWTRTTAEQQYYLCDQKPIAEGDVVEGDLVFFYSGSEIVHVGIYCGTRNDGVKMMYSALGSKEKGGSVRMTPINDYRTCRGCSMPPRVYGRLNVMKGDEQDEKE